jgi:arsenate reductase-like glutaredoxin family protein
MNIQDLSNEINRVMKELNIDKKNIDIYNKLHSGILANKITIKRLNIVINFLSNSNIINLKTKLIEVLLFELFKNNHESFELLNYMPTKYNIEELKNLIHIKLGEHNDVYQKEIERLTELANKTNDNKNDDPYIHLN